MLNYFGEDNSPQMAGFITCKGYTEHCFYQNKKLHAPHDQPRGWANALAVGTMNLFQRELNATRTTCDRTAIPKVGKPRQIDQHLPGKMTDRQ